MKDHVFSQIIVRNYRVRSRTGRHCGVRQQRCKGQVMSEKASTYFFTSIVTFAVIVGGLVSAVYFTVSHFVLGG